MLGAGLLVVPVVAIEQTSRSSRPLTKDVRVERLPVTSDPSLGSVKRHLTRTDEPV
jgi:hypothetical protein